MSDVYKIPLPLKLSLIYIPASRASILSNSIISWAGGWFFLTNAEVISMGSQTYKLVGLGSFIIDASQRGDTASLAMGVAALFLVIISTYILLWNPSVVKYTGVAFLPGVSIFYNLIEKAVVSLWKILVRAALKTWLLFARSDPAIMLIPVLCAGCWLRFDTDPVFYSVILGDALKYLNYFAGNAWLTLARVFLVIGVSALITIPLSYWASRHGRVGYASCVAGELLSSIPAVVWWPLLLPIAFKAPWR
ncbi:hypothetical protein [Desulfurococcus amylolyticus]|uniref:hypothetical protein n=1 Tax=Desulfurococcus amylolyticus TaxID=94694 RepID=UPI001F458BCA|nr:hypothetical protein [Desulfurococcus amylolyticus]